MKKIFTLLFASIIVLFAAGCASNLKTDRDHVASAALTYESVLDGLTTARKSGLIDDDTYRKIDPVIDTAHAILKSLKARVDSGEEVSDETLERMDLILDSLLNILLEYNVSQSRINDIQLMKFELQTIKAV